MILTLDESNNVIVTEKFLLIKDFRKIYDKFRKDPDLQVAHFGVMYYMYHFDSRFVWKYRDDEVKRLLEVRRFLHRGKDVKMAPDMVKAMKLYSQLYNEESVSMYVTMRDSIVKLRSYMQAAVLVLPKEENPDDPSVLVDSKELVMLNKEIPDQWKRLDKFEKDLLEYAKANLDIYGGGSVGVYE